MKSAEGENGQDMLKFAHHLALSSFGEDIADIEERVGFRAWTFSHVFRSSTVGFMEPSNIFRPDPDVYHLFLHTGKVLQ